MKQLFKNYGGKNVFRASKKLLKNGFIWKSRSPHLSWHKKCFRLLNKIGNMFCRGWIGLCLKTQKQRKICFMLNNDENLKKGTCFDYLLHLKSTNQIIGGVGVSCLDIKRPHKIEIGYWQDQKFCGYGYIREAVRLIENELYCSDYHS